MVLEIDDSKEIKEILEEIPKCQVNEFKSDSIDPTLPNEPEVETNCNGLTEPNDSPFRVRRLSRSFSIPNGIKLEDKITEAKDELFVGSNDENRQQQVTVETGASATKSKFILLKRSRSLGNIFLPAEVSKNIDGAIENLTEKVEALEIEVLPCNPSISDCEGLEEAKEEKVPLSDSPVSFKIDRPQTSPPILTAVPVVPPSSGETGGKPTILDRMQKSLGFIFRCARREEDEDGNAFKYPIRSHTPDPKFIRKPVKKVPVPVIKAQELQDNPNSHVPMQNVNVSNFVTKVDSESPTRCGEILKKLPQFIDVSGPKGPLLQAPSASNFGKKCLVLDLDETLVHSSFHVPESHDLVVSLGLPDGSQQNIYVAKRPGVDEFLARVSEKFEVVIFTASLAHYADPVIDFLTAGMNKHLHEPRDISLRLYRESCLFLRGLYVKDLSRLGRNLEHTVIVDNSPASFLLQPDHGIPIKSWFSDPTDRELVLLHDSLVHLVAAESVSEWRLSLSDL